MSEVNDKVYICIVCGHELTEPEYNDAPDNYECPECGVGKDEYVAVDL